MSDSQRLLQQMIVSTIDARERESSRISRLLHDDVGQVLSAVGLQLDVLKLDFKEDFPTLASRIDEIQQHLHHAMEQVRSISYRLNPAIVDRVGLEAALDHLVRRFESEYKGKLLYIYAATFRLPMDVASTVYRIAELALENAVTHAQASKIEISVTFSRKPPPAVTLEVRDNGKGFSVSEVQSSSLGLGLLLIENYATHVPLGVDVKSSPGKGTRVRAVYRPPEREPEGK
jgi:signal transduction histidine kinase